MTDVSAPLLEHKAPLVLRKKRDLFGFWIAGMINNFGYVVMLSAADALTKSHSAHQNKFENPALILLANNLPGFLTQSLAPYIMDYFPYWLRVSFASLCGVTSFFMTAFFPSVSVHLAGVAVGSVGSSFGEMTFLAYTAHYHTDSVSAWSSGTGAAGILGSVAYIALRSFLSNQETLFASCWVPLLTVFAFVFIIGKPLPLHEIDEFNENAKLKEKNDKISAENAKLPESDMAFPSTSSSSLSHRHRSMPVSQMTEKPDDLLAPSAASFSGVKSINYTSRNELEKINEDEGRPLSCLSKLKLLLKLSPFLWALGAVYFAEYAINQSIVTALQFPEQKTINLASQYAYYQVVYQVGVFVSRSSVNFLPIKSVWLLQLLPALQLFNAVFLALDAVYQFIPSIWIVSAVILFEGFMGGAVYVNTFYLISKKFTGKNKEFCLGSTSQAYGLSITLSAITGIFLTPWLKNSAAAAGHSFAPTPVPTTPPPKKMFFN